MKNVLLCAALLATSIFISGCGNRENRGNDYVFPESDSIPIDESEKLSQEAIEDIVQNISSPVEVAMLLQALNVPFKSENLASTKEAQSLSTSFIKAVKLGIYGSDLGYLNIYEKTSTAIDNLSTISNLANDLRVGQFLDFETLKRLAINRNNLDSLVYMSVHSYNEIDSYLRDNDRGHLSALMVTGVWLEAQFLVCELVSEYPHEELKNRIGEQKIILNDLLLLLRPYKDSSPDYSDLYNDFELIKEAYRPVKITYTPGEPETVEKDGRLVVVQNEESLVEISDEQLEAIIKITVEVRNKIISY